MPQTILARVETKTYPENTPLYHFYAKKTLFKSPKFATKIFGLEMTPPPLELFQKFITFGDAILPLWAVSGIAQVKTQLTNNNNRHPLFSVIFET